MKQVGLSFNNMEDFMGCLGALVGLAVMVAAYYVLYLIGGWVLSTFGVVGLIIFLILILN